MSKIKPRRPPKGRPFGADNPDYRDPELMEAFKKAKDNVDTINFPYDMFVDQAKRKGTTIKKELKDWDNYLYKTFLTMPEAGYIQ